jgi:8-oxo-dGTP diphosphatase
MTPQTLLPYALAIIINNQDQVLLQYRKHAEFFSDHYGLVGGKIEQKESVTQALARELFEEVAITFAPDDAVFVHVMDFMGQTRPCVTFFFIIRTWQGTVSNKEQDKYEHLRWFSFDKLPDNLIPRHRKGLELILKKISYSEDNW